MKTAVPATEEYVQRFDAFDRTLHVLLMASFLGLAATGLPLLFSHAAWASGLARLFGGFSGAGLVHRTSALLLIGVFLTHIGRLLHRLVVRGERGILWGPASMVPQPRDVIEMYRHMRWFIGRGPRPAFDRYTYWEKFDYMAVFWGMMIIGGSGLMLWFPEFFARFLPGWMFNIATLVHGEEALLAVGFIFTIHFFNTHLRPEKFPMDLVIFTGRVPAHEFREERSLELARLVTENTYTSSLKPPPDPGLVRLGKIVGNTAVAIGLTLVVLILYALAI